MPTDTAIQARAAASADIPFLARIEVIASAPPFPESMWTPLLAVTGTGPEAFMEAVLAEDASRWGGVEDFVVLERGGRPLAACAVFDADPAEADRRTLRLERLPAVAERLGWNAATLEGFLARYEAAWGVAGGAALEPQAPAIVESVGVLPEARGLGLGRRLMAEAFALARRRGHGALGIMAIHGNDAARRLYEAVGFRPWASFHAAFFGDGFPGVTKYRAALAG